MRFKSKTLAVCLLVATSASAEFATSSGSEPGVTKGVSGEARPDAPVAVSALPPSCSTTGIAGPLRVSSANPRYFTNDCGKAVYLTGSHTWNNLIDMDDQYPAANQPFNYGSYLDFLEQWGHSFFRLWAWECPFPDDSATYPRRVWADPQPWLRTGPGTDVTGKPRFDLTRWNQAYFDRLHARVLAAQDRGLYVSVMLFEGWELQFARGRFSHPFNGDNNVNGIDFGADPTLVDTMSIPAITALQEEYVHRVIDAVNDLDNVMYEVANEPGTYSTEWQRHIVALVRQYEATKTKQHPVGMTFQYPGGSTSTLFASNVEWISPGTDTGSYATDPAPADGSKVIVTDTDHLGGSPFGDRHWVWRSFTRGLNPIFMDRYDAPDSVAGGPIPKAEEIRRAMGQTNSYTARVDLLSVTPQPALASSGYVLAGADEYLVYDPDGGDISVDLRGRAGTFQVEWFNPQSETASDGGEILAGEQHALSAPFAGESVLYLYRTADTAPLPPTGLGIH